MFTDEIAQMMLDANRCYEHAGNEEAKRKAKELMEKAIEAILEKSHDELNDHVYEGEE